jgi:two-component sensor histidine kinase/DNA-binding response OmpR family regulator
MTESDKVNVLLVDDQPAKLISYEVILRELGENLIQASSGREALEQLLKNDIAVVLIDVVMPELDGFQLAAMIREHPRFEKTAIIFISAVLMSDVDRLRGYEMGAVDYVPVPVIPEVLRAKVRIFAELHRKTRQLERLNAELERRVAERTADLASSNALLLQSERRRTMALAAGQMGSWDYDVAKANFNCDEGQYRIFGVDPATFPASPENLRRLANPDDFKRLQAAVRSLSKDDTTCQAEFRIRRPDGELRWCMGTATASFDDEGRLTRISGVTVDITERKQAEERQALLAREVDHRARNALAIIQAIVRLTRARTIADYKSTVEGRIMALARAHTLLSESRWRGADFDTLVADELAPYRAEYGDRIVAIGPPVSLQPITAQTLALSLHELATNAAKYGALSTAEGTLTVSWELRAGRLAVLWRESGVRLGEPQAAQQGFGLRLISTSVEQQLGGKANFEWTPAGLRCDIVVPLREAAIAPGQSSSRTKEEAPETAPAAKSVIDLRVLLVEDEALVAMMMQDVLEDLGCTIFGPYRTLASAVEAAKDEAVDLALLDINLGDELVYPAAEILAARGVRFVFLTGYDNDHVDTRFRYASVLQKPFDREALQRVLTESSEAPLEAVDARLSARA